MVYLKIVPIDDLQWKVYIREEKKAEIAEALKELEYITCVLTHNDEMLVVSISHLAEESDIDKLHILLKRLASVEEDVPAKPQRHPILDEKWSITEVGRLVDGNGSHISYSSKHNPVLARVPDLLRELEEHLKTGSNWTAIRSVMARMGL